MHPIMQESGNFNLQMNIIKNTIEKCINLILGNKLVFIKETFLF